MSASRLPFPQFNSFRDFVLTELKRRKTTFPSTTNAPFVRMTSMGESKDQKYKYFSLGLHGLDAASLTNNTFDLTYGMGKEVVGYAYDTGLTDANGNHTKKLIFSDNISAGHDPFDRGSNDTPSAISVQNVNAQKASIPRAAHPIPGITNVDVVRSGLGQPLQVKVSWQCYNRGQLEFLRNHFLIPGQFVAVEFGHQFANQRISKTLDFSNFNQIESELLTCVGAVGDPDTLLQQVGRSYIIDKYNTPNNGNYDFVVGQIGPFDISYEPQTNIYKCTTNVVSQGENIWGLRIEKTYVNQSTGSASNSISSISEYFDKGAFKNFIQANIKSNTIGVVPIKGSNLQNVSTDPAKSLGDASSNVNNYAFLSWKFFFVDLFSNMIAVINSAAIQKQIRQYARFFDVGTPANPQTDDYVGYHPLLRSADPETMLIINRDVSFLGDGAYGGLRNNGIFGTTKSPSGAGAKITEGIWLNAQAIQDCFSHAENMQQALSSLLMAMNRAVGGYWQLQIFADEENATYKIVDYKFGDQARNQKFYVFNVGGMGECLSVELDSQFPPELMSQFMLAAKFATATPEEQQHYITQLPLLGTTSAHAFVINWTDLEDSLQKKIASWRDSGVTAKPELGIQDINPGIDQSPSTTLSTLLTPITTPEGSTLTQENVTRHAGQPVGDPNAISQTSPPDAVAINPVRNSVKALQRANVSSPSTDPTMLDPDFWAQIQELMGDLGAAGWTVQIYEAWRSQARQLYLFGQGPGITQTTDSAHTHGAAIDLLVFKSPYTPNTADDSPDGYNFMRSLIDSGKYSLLSYIPTTSTFSDLRHVQRVNYRSLPKKEIEGNSDSDPAGNNVTANTGTTETQQNIGPLQPFSLSRARAGATTPTVQSEHDAALSLRTAEIRTKFGDVMVALVANHLGDMIQNITADGYKDPTQPNSFVAPFPTTTSISVDIVGIAGISISDGFFVDKIPFTFEKFGLFQVTEVTDSISTSGWISRVKGYFKMLWYDGRGNSLKDF